MKDYSQYTLDDFRAMSTKEFEEYAQVEFKTYMDNIRHNEDVIPYGEFFTELEAMLGRRRKSWSFA